MKFRSKIDWWMHLVFLSSVVANIWILILFILQGGVFLLIMLLFFTPLNVLFIVPVWFNTYYVTGDNGLTIKCGIRKEFIIPYESIISAASTKDPLASAALSLDRIELVYRHLSNKFSDTVLISPVEKQEFFKQLGSKNENIKIMTETKPTDKGYKLFLIIILGVCGAVLIWAAVSSVAGEFDPAVSINDNGITISGMYGLDINSEQITGVTLIEKSMLDIPGSSGMRTNGFDGFGQAQKGYFSSPELGMNIRFVQARTSPTIHIECLTYSVFISFRNSDKTRAFFEELQNVEW